MNEERSYPIAVVYVTNFFAFFFLLAEEWVQNEMHVIDIELRHQLDSTFDSLPTRAAHTYNYPKVNKCCKFEEISSVFTHRMSGAMQKCPLIDLFQFHFMAFLNNWISCSEYFSGKSILAEK